MFNWAIYFPHPAVPLPASTPVPLSKGANKDLLGNITQFLDQILAASPDTPSMKTKTVVIIYFDCPRHPPLSQSLDKTLHLMSSPVRNSKAGKEITEPQQRNLSRTIWSKRPPRTLISLTCKHS